MRLLGILISLAIIGYTASLYLNSEHSVTSTSELKKSDAKEYIDQTKHAADEMNNALNQHKKALQKQLN